MPLIFVRYVLETKLRKSPSKPDALTNLSRRGSVLEIDGRHVGTRTPDLYRVNEFKNGKSGTCKPYSGRSVAFRTVGNTNCSQIVPTRRIGNAPPDHYRNAVVSTALECPNLSCCQRSAQSNTALTRLPASRTTAGNGVTSTKASTFARTASIKSQARESLLGEST